MDKTLQDLAWSLLPKEFKEEVKKMYKVAQSYIIGDVEINARVCESVLLELFGRHNLTSDAEGEEMLTVPRKKVLYMYDFNEDFLICDPTHNGAKLLKAKLQELFGSKCLPGEKENKKPKFKVGEKIMYKGVLRVIDSIDTVTHRYHLSNGNYYAEWVDESDLEPYTEQDFNKEPSTCTDDRSSQCSSQSRNLSQFIANCDKDFDNILKDDFREHNRLHIAAMAMQGILAAGEDYTGNCKFIAMKSLELADTLITEAEKGDTD